MHCGVISVRVAETTRSVAHTTVTCPETRVHMYGNQSLRAAFTESFMAETYETESVAIEINAPISIALLRDIYGCNRTLLY